MRALVALLAPISLVACSSSPPPETSGAQSAAMGESLAALGWNSSVSNLRFDEDHVLVDVDAAAAHAGSDAPRAFPLLGPLRDQTQLRGVSAHSPQDRMPGTAVGYGVSFPVGLLPTNENDAGLMLETTTVGGFGADGAQLLPTALGERPPSTATGTCCWGSTSPVPHRDTARTPNVAADPSWCW